MTVPLRVVPAGAGEVLGDGPNRRVELLDDRPALHATSARFGPGRAGADLHVHREHADLFYVLEGELTVRLGPDGAPVALRAGTLALVPPLVVHGFRNASEADVRYLNLHAPGCGFADYMRGLRDARRVVYDQHEPPPDGRSPDDVQIAAVGDADVQLLAEDEHVAVSAVRLEPGTPLTAPPGEEAEATEALFVLEGELAIATPAETTRAAAGAWVRLPSPAGRMIAATRTGEVRLLRAVATG